MPTACSASPPRSSIGHGNRRAELPLLEPTLGPPMIDTRRLREETGCWAYDPSFGADRRLPLGDHLCRRRRGRAALSRLSDRPAGRALRIISKSAGCCSTATCRARRSGRNSSTTSPTTRCCNEQLHAIFRGFRRDAHPMAVMCGVVGALAAFYHDSLDIFDPHHRLIASHRLIAKMPTIAAMAYKYSLGQPFIYPRNDLGYAENFLHMLLRGAVRGVSARPDAVQARSMRC